VAVRPTGPTLLRKLLTARQLQFRWVVVRVSLDSAAVVLRDLFARLARPFR
jgi:hypothetical protein